MDIDNRDVVVQRKPLMLAVGTVGILLSLITLVVNALRLASALMTTRVAVAEVPLGPNSFPETVARWKEQGVEPAGQITMQLAVDSPPHDVLVGLTAGYVIGAVTYLLVASLFLTLSMALLAGRLQWRWLAPSAAAAGLAIAGGEIASQLVLKQATTALSQYVQRDLGSWYEPTFGVGTSPAMPTVGLVVASAAIVFHLTSRLARDADGLV